MRRRASPFTLFGHRLLGDWVYSDVAAYVIGIAFQYCGRASKM